MRIDEDVLPEFRQLSQSFNQMLERLNNAFAAQRQFTGNAAHELRTPLALMHDFLKRFPPAERLELLHYHNLGRAKAEGLGWDQALFQAPEAARILQIRDALEGCAKAILIS